MKNTERNDELIKAVETKLQTLTDSNEFRKYLKQMSCFHNYSFDNILLILSQRSNSSRVAGFKTWEKLSRKVKKGSKAIYIKAPITKKLTEEEKIEKKTTNDYAIVGFRFVPVFDISDTEGEPLIDTKHFINDFKTTEQQALYCQYKMQALVNYVEENFGIPVKVEDLGKNYKEADGFYNHVNHEIKIKETLPYTEQLTTFFHEFAHALMHNQNSPLHLASRSVKEVHAEAVALLSMQAQNIDTSDFSIGYIATWGQDMNVMKQALQDIHEMFNVALKVIEETPVDMEKILENEISYQDICNNLGMDLKDTSFRTYHELFEKEAINIIKDNFDSITPTAIERFKEEIGAEATKLLEKDIVFPDSKQETAVEKPQKEINPKKVISTELSR